MPQDFWPKLAPDQITPEAIAQRRTAYGLMLLGAATLEDFNNKPFFARWVNMTGAPEQNLMAWVYGGEEAAAYTETAIECLRQYGLLPPGTG